MKLVTFAAVGALLCICTGALLADEPYLAQPVQLFDGPNPMNVGKHSIPCVVDWNNDGKKDILIGVYEYVDQVWLLLNQGTNENPVFNGAVNITDNGVPITVTYG